MGKKSISVFELGKIIKKASKTSENYHTGLVGEQIIVASYKQMDLEKLEKLRYIINKIIKKKKEALRVRLDYGNREKRKSS